MFILHQLLNKLSDCSGRGQGATNTPRSTTRGTHSRLLFCTSCNQTGHSFDDCPSRFVDPRAPQSTRLNNGRSSGVNTLRGFIELFVVSIVLEVLISILLFNLIICHDIIEFYFHSFFFRGKFRSTAMPTVWRALCTANSKYRK
jgi:hypothetical protein